MPSAATAAKWQLVIDPAKLWLVVEIKNGEAKKASCKLCTKWQNKVRRSRNYNDALICGIEGNALKKDNIVKHEMSDQHRDAVRFEKGPFSVADVYKHTTIGNFLIRLRLRLLLTVAKIKLLCLSDSDCVLENNKF